MNERPARIGAYFIEREIGRGGMGIVYLARDPELDRAVAIKVLPDSVSDDPVRLDGSKPPTRIGEAPAHDSWLALPDGRILLTVDNGTAFQVLSQAGIPAGPPRRIDTEDVTGRFDLGYLGHRSMVDDRTVLVVMHYVSGGAMKTGVAILHLDTGKAARLIDEGRYAILVAPGWLLFSRGEARRATP